MGFQADDYKSTCKFIWNLPIVEISTFVSSCCVPVNAVSGGGGVGWHGEPCSLYMLCMGGIQEMSDVLPSVPAVARCAKIALLCKENNLLAQINFRKKWTRNHDVRTSKAEIKQILLIELSHFNCKMKCLSNSSETFTTIVRVSLRDYVKLCLHKMTLIACVLKSQWTRCGGIVFRPTFQWFVPGFFQNHPESQNAFLQSHEALVVGPVHLERVLDEVQDPQQVSLVQVLNRLQHVDLQEHRKGC